MGALLEGIDDFVTIPDSNDWNFGGGDFTINMWVNLPTVQNAPFMAQDRIAGSAFGWTLFHQDATTMFFQVRDLSGVVIVSIGPGVSGLQNGVGAMISVTRTGNRFDLWKNAVSFFNSSDASSIPDYSSPLFIARTNGVYGNLIVNDVAIWKGVAVSGAELSLSYNSRVKHMPLQIQPLNLVAYLPMDDGQDGTSADGATVSDMSGNGNNGTGDDGANNTGLTWKAEEVLSYPGDPVYVVSPPSVPSFIPYPRISGLGGGIGNSMRGGVG